jgi:hypothetical protein
VKDILTRILADAALMAALAAGFAFIMKKWITEAVSHHFKSTLEKEKAVLEIEKTKELGMLQNQTSALPQCVELVYRLRNEFRNKMERIQNPDMGYPGQYGPESRVTGFGEELYLLTENLYKFRLFLDEATFDALHKMKRELQDANVLINTLTRPPDRRDSTMRDLSSDERQKRMADLFNQQLAAVLPELEEKWAEVDRLYPEIVRRAKEQMRTFLRRELSS